MSSTTTSLPRLAIIGTGWAGFYIAEYIDTALYSVSIVSPRRTSAYTPLLASAACGLFNFYLAEEPVRSKARSAIQYVKANVLSIDFEKTTLKCAPAFEEDPELAKDEFDIEYDILIIAPGCIPNTFNTPGVAEHALFMKNVSDAMAVRKLLFDLLEKASLPHMPDSRISDLLHIAIVGGGPTGIELTAELDDLAKHELKHLYPRIADKIRISIYDVAPNILSSYDKKLYEYANGQLVRRNVHVSTSSRIAKVDDSAMYLAQKDSDTPERVPYGMLIWATGNKNTALVDSLAGSARTSEKGLKRILTDNHLRVFKGQDEIYDSVYALGDAADIDGASLPTTAEVAVQKAKYLVGNLNNAKAPASGKAFEYRQKALVSYIGQHDGVIAGKEGREGWTGKSAWLAWRSGSVMWTRSWRNRVTILITWGLNLVFGKELAKM
jgi:NADH:ubiquinone reductase (non-electrogenic)